MVDELQLIENQFREIKSNWAEASLGRKENYVSELTRLEDLVIDIRSIEATKLLHAVRYLRGHIEEKIVPAQQKHRVDLWRKEEKLPGHSA